LEGAEKAAIDAFRGKADFVVNIGRLDRGKRGSFDDRIGMFLADFY
jgi:hypothetical protein